MTSPTSNPDSLEMRCGGTKAGYDRIVLPLQKLRGYLLALVLQQSKSFSSRKTPWAGFHGQLAIEKERS